MKTNLLSVFIVGLFLTTSNLMSQVMLREIPLKQQIENASLVVEGKVISKKSFWDVKHEKIYTANTIEVYKVFKGAVVSTIEVVTVGGTIGDVALIVFPNLNLKVGDIGVFTLYDSNIALSQEAKTQNKQFRVYSSSQGFYKYNLHKDVVISRFGKTQGIESLFYGKLLNLTKSKYVEVESVDMNALYLKSAQSNKALAPSISSFTPITAIAGMKTMLTINGSGFGITKGKVGFANADDGGSTYAEALDSQVLSWADNKITVEIPSEAGTGKIQVTDASSASIESSSDLTILYSEINGLFDPDDATNQNPPGTNGPLGLYAYPTRLVNNNGSGGYTWEMETGFFNDNEFPGAKTAFERVIDQWRCATGVNWTISNSATNIDVLAYDEHNIVRFDNPGDNDLAIGDLGKCFYYLSACGFLGVPTSWNVHVAELDIVFDSETTWFFGDGLPNTGFDFETVTLHELGHGHQLGHVIDTSSDGNNMDDVMYYALSPFEQQRVLNTNNLTAANDVLSRSTSIVACSQSVMTNYSCPLSVDDIAFNEAVKVYPNPSNGQFYINNELSINLTKAVVFDMSGRLISVFDISNSSNTKQINLTGLSKGIYLVNIHSNDVFVTKKLVLE